MNVFKEIVHLIEDFTDIPEEDEKIIKWAEENRENAGIFDIYTYASFFSILTKDEIPEKKKKRQKIKKCVKTVLKNANIPKDFLGFKYLEAILIDSYDHFDDYKISDLYQEYATKFKVTPIRIERAIRYITDSYQRQLQRYFDKRYKITAKKLIFLLQNEVQKELESCL